MHRSTQFAESSLPNEWVDWTADHLRVMGVDANQDVIEGLVAGMLPAQYSAIGKSELSADVTAKGPNDFQFDLK